MKKLSLLLVALFAVISAQATELYDRLLKIEGVSSVEEIGKGFFSERYVVMFNQPLDHKKPQKGTFTQRVVVSHAGFDRPTQIITEGYGAAYALSPRYREEISAKLNTNQVFVEHRFFGESTPEPREWKYMTGENAAADLHAIRIALREIYSEKWVASGISKGGQNTMIYATFYPGDVDAYVPYVGPVCFGVEDGRHEPFIEKAGTEEQRKVILDYQIEVLNRREALMPGFEKFCNEKGYKFRIPMEEIYDYCVLEYPFTVWQWGMAVTVIPTQESTDEEILEHLLKVVPPDYFAISDEPSFFVQAARELGYYGYDIKPFEGLLKIKSAEGYLYKIFLPEDAARIKFDRTLANKITKYLQDNDPNMLFVYGEFDPWSAVMPAEKLFEGKQNMKLYVQKDGSHRARIKTLTREEQDEIWEKLSKWLK